MSTGYRNADTRYPPLWESPDQPAARWHAQGEGPCQYLADTPDGAWAEFLRHEEITDPGDLTGVRRSLWAIGVPDSEFRAAHDARRAASIDVSGPNSSYPDCQVYARAARSQGATMLIAPSAALRAGSAGGQIVDGTLREAPPADGQVWAVYGRRPAMRCWRVVRAGAPDERVLERVRPLT